MIRLSKKCHLAALMASVGTIIVSICSKRVLCRVDVFSFSFLVTQLITVCLQRTSCLLTSPYTTPTRCRAMPKNKRNHRLVIRRFRTCPTAILCISGISQKLIQTHSHTQFECLKWKRKLHGPTELFQFVRRVVSCELWIRKYFGKLTATVFTLNDKTD